MDVVGIIKGLIMGKVQKIAYALTLMFIILATFAVFSGLIYSLLAYLDGKPFSIETSVLFTLSVFLGSASYDFCKSLGKVGVEEIPNLLWFLVGSIAHFLIFIAIMLCVIYLLDDSTINAQGFGGLAFIGLIVYEIYLLRAVDKKTNQFIDHIEANEQKKLYEKFKEFLEKDYILKKRK